MGAAYDAVVCGAGPAGSAVAARLAMAGHRVALIERGRLEGQRFGESLAPAVLVQLQQLGALERLRSTHPIPCWGTRSYWADEMVEHSHMGTAAGHGWHVDRALFDRELAHHAREAGAECHFETRVADARLDGRTWAVELRAGGARRELRARFLVDATGRNGSLSRRLGAVRHRFDRLVGVASWFEEHDLTHEGFLLIEACPSGWWYSAPAPGSGMIALLMTDADVLRANELANPETYASVLRKAEQTARRVGRSPQSRPKVVSATSQRLARSEVSEPWLAVGDASLAVDPLSGSGVVRALSSARAAAQAIEQVLRGRPVADEVSAYETSRDQEFTAYLEGRLQQYALQSRFADSPFWARRHQVARRHAEPRSR